MGAIESKSVSNESKSDSNRLQIQDYNILFTSKDEKVDSLLSSNIKEITSGSFGDVYGLKQYPHIIMKHVDYVQQIQEDIQYGTSVSLKDMGKIFRNEYVIQNIAGKAGIAPKIYTAIESKSGRHGRIYMERCVQIEKHIKHQHSFVENVLALIVRMHDAAILHSDMYKRNLMQSYDRKNIYIIDYGMAVHYKDQKIPIVLRLTDMMSFVLGEFRKPSSPYVNSALPKHLIQYGLQWINGWLEHDCGIKNYNVRFHMMETALRMKVCSNGRIRYKNDETIDINSLYFRPSITREQLLILKILNPTKQKYAFHLDNADETDVDDVDTMMTDTNTTRNSDTHREYATEDHNNLFLPPCADSTFLYCALLLSCPGIEHWSSGIIQYFTVWIERQYRLYPTDPLLEIIDFKRKKIPQLKNPYAKSMVRMLKAWEKGRIPPPSVLKIWKSLQVK
jgi:hypothetical protein